MFEGGVGSARPAGRAVDCCLASELLQSGQYERVAAVLHTAQTHSAQTGDAILAHMLDAARRLCLACKQCRAEVEWHRQAYQEAEKREQELRRQLDAILDLVGRAQAPNIPEKPEQIPSTSQAQIEPPEPGLPGPEERLSLWQRVQILLGRKLIPLSTGLTALVAVPGQPGNPSAHPLEALRDPDPVLGQNELQALIGEPDPPSPEEAEIPIIPTPIAAQEAAIVSAVGQKNPREVSSPSVAVYCLGPFQVYQDDRPVENWPSSKGRSILKYIVTHRQRPIAKEILMELFWPGAHPDAARNNLNVAIYGLRQALRQIHPSFSHVLFQDDSYVLNPDLQIWVDCEAFTEHVSVAQNLEQQGELDAAMREYRVAEALYQGEFLAEDRYEDWPIRQRQRLQNDYLDLLDRLGHYYFDEENYDACVTFCRKMLALDACREDAHSQLMRCYSRQGQPYLALRQYHLCVERLKEELDASPTLKTKTLYEQIRQGVRI